MALLAHRTGGTWKDMGDVEHEPQTTAVGHWLAGWWGRKWSACVGWTSNVISREKGGRSEATRVADDAMLTKDELRDPGAEGSCAERVGHKTQNKRATDGSAVLGFERQTRKKGASVAQTP